MPTTGGGCEVTMEEEGEPPHSGRRWNNKACAAPGEDVCCAGDEQERKVGGRVCNIDHQAALNRDVLDSIKSLPHSRDYPTPVPCKSMPIRPEVRPMPVQISIATECSQFTCFPPPSRSALLKFQLRLHDKPQVGVCRLTELANTISTPSAGGGGGGLNSKG